MKRELNLEQLRFHVLEAKTELDNLLLAIEHALGNPVAEDGKWNLPDKPFDEWMLHGSLYHAYHHMNFGWNSRRCVDTRRATDAFSKNENFPRPSEAAGWTFDRFWAKRCLKCLVEGKRKTNPSTKQ